MEKQIIYKSTSTLGLLGIAFVVLKLIGVINWSWWLVTLPFWVPIIGFFLCITLALLIVGAIVMINIR